MIAIDTVRRRLRSQAVLGGLDQIAMAAAHFLSSVMVARLGGIDALGSFAFAYAIIVLVNMLHTAAVAEVYSINPNVSPMEQRYGSAPITLMTAVVCTIALAACAAGAALSEQIRTAIATPSFCLALVASAFYWSIKPYYYQKQQPLTVLAVTCVYAAVTLVTMLLGYRLAGPTMQPLWALAAGATVASFHLLSRFKRLDAASKPLVSEYLRASAAYSRWAVPAAILIWGNANGYLIVLALLSDTAQAGAMRVIMNVVAPINTLLVGACTAVLPMMARMHRQSDPTAYATRIHRFALQVLGLSLLGALALALLSRQIITIIYGDSYASLADILEVAAILPVLWAVTSVYRAAMRAQGNARDLFKIYAFALIPIGVTLMLLLSRAGAMSAVIGMLVTQLLVLVGFLLRFTRVSRGGAG